MIETPDPAGMPDRLSASGESRREALLPVLERAMRARVRRRRAARVGAAAAAIGAIVFGAAVFSRGTHTLPAPHQELARNDAPAESRLSMRYASFRVVETRPIDASPPTGPSLITEIDDDRLLRELRAMGHPTGLIRTRGQVVLTSDIGIKPEPTEPGES